jgi:hypothetical protein
VKQSGTGNQILNGAVQTVMSGGKLSIASGGEIEILAGATVTFGTGVIPWAAVSKSGASVADFSAGTLLIARGGTGGTTAIGALDSLITAEATVASATTTDLGAVTSRNVSITGTTTITGFGTAAAGVMRFGRFTGALTLTHNGTSLILPSAASITTAANDRFVAVSLGSGNWLVYSYTRASGAALVTSGGTVTHTGGTLTSNALVLGAGTDDTKVAAGLTTDGTSKLVLGVAGSAVGGVDFKNATSGTLTLQPATGALGTVTLTLPAATDTVAVLAASQTLTNKTLGSGTAVTAAISYTAGVKQTFAPDATTSGLNVGSFAGAPSSLANGDLFYDSTAGALKARIAGSTVSLGAGGGGSGTVNSGTANQLAYFASTGTAVSGLTSANDGVLVTSSSGVPSISSTLPNVTVFPASGQATLAVKAAASQTTRILFQANNDGPAITELGVAGATNAIITGSATGDMFFAVSGGSQRIIFSTVSGLGAIGFSLESANAGISWAGSTTGTVPVKSNLTVFPASGAATLAIKAAAAQTARILFQSNNDGPAVTDISVAGATNSQITGSAVGDMCFRINGNSQNFLFSGDSSTIVLKITAGQVLAEKTTNATTTTDAALVSKGGLSVASDIVTGGAIKTAAPSGGTAAAWKHGTVASVTPTAPNRTIELDVGGTRYFLHAKTTND